MINSGNRIPGRTQRLRYDRGKNTAGAKFIVAVSEGARELDLISYQGTTLWETAIAVPDL
jgi:hypothetical protein